MFTVEQRDALREHLLRLAEEDERVVAGAAVGSLAVDGGDRFSDLDLTFAIADHVPAAQVLDDWTRTLIGERDALQLADLERGPTIYRVFLLPDALQFDLSLTPAAQFRPAGPRFRLLFGETAAGAGARLRRPFSRDPGSIRGCSRWRGRTWGAPGGPRRLRSCAHARGARRRVYRTRMPSRSTSLSCADGPQRPSPRGHLLGTRARLLSFVARTAPSCLCSRTNR